MTKQQVNEYIAEHYFDKQRGVDFGALNAPKCAARYSCEYWMEDSEGNCGGCDNDGCQVEVSDYVNNYQPVLEKLMELPRVNNIDISHLHAGERLYRVLIQDFDEHDDDGIYVTGDTIGEAICKAAVEYMKTKRGGV